MAEVTLSAAVRSSLLSLQGTSDLIKQTQGRLSSGLRVASAIDDPVAYFQAKSLSDRAGDLTQKKDGINQGVSSVSAALDAVTSVESVVQQLKGLAQSMKAATGSQFTDLITQFNSLRTQIGNLVTDATYQGTNLVNNTSQTLTVTFSEKTASLLTVNASKLDQQGLALGTIATYNSNTSLMVNFSAASVNVRSGVSFVFTYQGTDATFTTGTTASFTIGTATVTLSLNTGSSITLTQGTVFSGNFATAGSVANATGATAGTAFFITTATSAGSTNTTTGQFTTWVSEGDSTRIDGAITQLDTALTTLRAQASGLGSNVALLQTRLDFTSQYTNTLTTGASKLTLADINMEGANLLALQTRQQLGITSLSFAGKAEQGILRLFQ